MLINFGIITVDKGWSSKAITKLNHYLQAIVLYSTYTKFVSEPVVESLLYRNKFSKSKFSKTPRQILKVKNDSDRARFTLEQKYIHHTHIVTTLISSCCDGLIFLFNRIKTSQIRSLHKIEVGLCLIQKKKMKKKFI